MSRRILLRLQQPVGPICRPGSNKRQANRHVNKYGGRGCWTLFSGKVFFANDVAVHNRFGKQMFHGCCPLVWEKGIWKWCGNINRYIGGSLAEFRWGSINNWNSQNSISFTLSSTWDWPGSKKRQATRRVNKYCGHGCCNICCRNVHVILSDDIGKVWDRRLQECDVMATYFSTYVQIYIRTRTYMYLYI